MTSTVYVIKSDPGPVKIGIARNVQSRLRQLKTASPYPLTVVHTTKPHVDASSLERRAHEILSDFRLSGEWFDVPVPDAIAAVDQAAQDVSGWEIIRLPSVTRNIKDKNIKADDDEVMNDFIFRAEKVAEEAGVSVRDLVEQLLIPRFSGLTYPISRPEAIRGMLEVALVIVGLSHSLPEPRPLSWTGNPSRPTAIRGLVGGILAIVPTLSANSAPLSPTTPRGQRGSGA